MRATCWQKSLPVSGRGSGGGNASSQPPKLNPEPIRVQRNGQRHKTMAMVGLANRLTRPSAYVVAFLFASFLAPPDIWVQMALSLLLLVLVEFHFLRAAYLKRVYEKRLSVRL
jgi:uncharacterized membrane protein